MLNIYLNQPQGVTTVTSASEVPADAVWIDLNKPTTNEEAAIEAALKVDIPTREELYEIEASSRLFKEGDAIFMTASVISNADTAQPESSVVTFILVGQRLVTLRYFVSQAFTNFTQRLQREPGLAESGASVLVGLLESVVDRIADILERVGYDLEAVSREIFGGTATGAQRHTANELRDVLRRIGRNGDLTSKARESLMSLSRLLPFLNQATRGKIPQDITDKIKMLHRDTESLSTHASFIADKANFLLDATLGIINIEQNNTVRIFSVTAVVFLPPTLVASVYGMNFEFMPELHWKLGYPFGVALMIASAVLPYFYFKHRRWL